MLPKYTLPVLAVAGFAAAALTVINGNQPAPIAAAAVEPSRSPFQFFIAGAGIIEAKSQNIEIGSPLNGIVKSVLVKVGDPVKAGAPLFRLDDREALADLALRRADLARAQAAVGEAEASLTDVKTLMHLADNISDKRAISTEELDRRRNATLIAHSRLQSARAQVLQAEAGVAAVETTLDRLVVKAPVSGQVLQANIRAGEFASAGTLSQPLMILGDLEQLYVRVDIDENDAWRFKKDGKAIAYLRGNRQFSTELTLAWLEPFVVPKKSLTGDSTERVDTRVLQALYWFDRDKLPAYVGQQMDVFIETPDPAGSTPPSLSPVQ